MKKRRYAAALAGVALAMVLLFLGRENEPKEVARMKYTCGPFSYDPPWERIVDLENGMVWAFDPEWDKVKKKYSERDETAENEGYALLCELTAQQAGRIQAACAEVRLPRWKKEYPRLAMDGLWWRLEITYTDGTTQKCHGASGWPKEFKKLDAVLAEIAGEEEVLPHMELYC